jgi:hypothetical protein
MCNDPNEDHPKDFASTKPPKNIGDYNGAGADRTRLAEPLGADQIGQELGKGLVLSWIVATIKKKTVKTK